MPIGSTDLKTRFNESTPDFVDFLEKHLGISRHLEAGSPVTLIGREDVRGFEYFRLKYHELDMYIPRFSGKIVDVNRAAGLRSAFAAMPARLSEAQETTRRSISSLYDHSFFAYSHMPIPVGNIPPEAFQARMPNCSDMPIRVPGQPFKIPEEYFSLAPEILAIDLMSQITNPAHDQFSVALTVDTRPQLPHQSQRRAGAHTDGFQGPRVEPKTIGEYSFICGLPDQTVYFPSAYPELQYLDCTIFDAFEAMDILTYVHNNGERSALRYQPPPGQVQLVDCYTVHDVPFNESDSTRSRGFMRVTYTVRLFDRLGNSVNPHLPLPSYELRNTPLKLRKPTLDDILKCGL